jgi:hypothetical protein
MGSGALGVIELILGSAAFKTVEGLLIDVAEQVGIGIARDVERELLGMLKKYDVADAIGVRLGGVIVRVLDEVVDLKTPIPLEVRERLAQSLADNVAMQLVEVADLIRAYPQTQAAAIDAKERGAADVNDLLRAKAQAQDDVRRAMSDVARALVGDILKELPNVLLPGAGHAVVLGAGPVDPAKPVRGDRPVVATAPDDTEKPETPAPDETTADKAKGE